MWFQFQDSMGVWVNLNACLSIKRVNTSIQLIYTGGLAGLLSYANLDDLTQDYNRLSARLADRIPVTNKHQENDDKVPF